MSERNVKPRAFYQNLRKNWSFWNANANLNVQKLVSHGLEKPSNLNENLSCRPQHKSTIDIKDAEKILRDYESAGAVRLVPPGEVSKHLIPWFIVRKTEGDKEKLRLIADCREINAYFQPKTFRLDHLQNIFPVLRRGMWGIKIDLKHAYFHVGLEESLRKWIHLQVGNHVWEFQAAPFGLNVLPQKFMELMKTFLRLWRRQGMMVYIYLDDILLVGTTPKQVEKQRDVILRDLEMSGMKVNYEKSTLIPAQSVQHLGFILDFQQGLIRIPPEKLRAVRKDMGKLLVKSHITTRKMAAILGKIRSVLTAMPFLRAFTDELVHFLRQQKHHGWDAVGQIPESLKSQIREVKDLLLQNPGRPFQQKEPPSRRLASDSSNHAWGGMDLVSGSTVSEFWRLQGTLHINVKELIAAIATVKSLAKRHDRVRLLVDNATTFWYLKRQGGRHSHFNAILRPFLRWCVDMDVQLDVQLVKSEDMPADKLSRRPRDRGDYELNRPLFWHMWRQFRLWLPPSGDMIDMFASPGNKKFHKFFSRDPHWGAVGVDALQSPLNHLRYCYANPPWTVIRTWLSRLLDHPTLTCWTVVPYWASSDWFPLLRKLLVPRAPILVVQPFRGMFQSCMGECMPAPRWPLLFCLLSGKYFRSIKFRMNPKVLYWNS